MSRLVLGNGTLLYRCIFLLRRFYAFEVEKCVTNPHLTPIWVKGVGSNPMNNEA
jgi:hypothetical protein